MAVDLLRREERAEVTALILIEEGAALVSASGGLLFMRKRGVEVRGGRCVRVSGWAGALVWLAGDPCNWGCGRLAEGGRQKKKQEERLQGQRGGEHALG